MKLWKKLKAYNAELDRKIGKAKQLVKQYIELKYDIRSKLENLNDLAKRESIIKELNYIEMDVTFRTINEKIEKYEIAINRLEGIYELL